MEYDEYYDLFVEDGEEEIELELDDTEVKPEQVKDIVPAYESQTVYPDPGMTIGQVNVAAIPDPTAVKDISENGDHNVARYGTARVNVPQGVFPEGTLEITENGIHNVTNYENAHVNVQPTPHANLLYEYTADGTTSTITIPVNEIDIVDYRTLWISIDLGLPKSDWIYTKSGERTCWDSQGYRHVFEIFAFVKRNGLWYNVIKNSSFASITTEPQYIGDIVVYTYSNTLFSSGTIKLYGET